MPLTRLEHVLIQCADMEATRDWYVDVLGLEEGPHPEFGFPVCWLYLDGVAVLHLAEGGENVSANRLRYLGQQSTATRGSGVVDHLAFRATGLAAVLAHLEARGIECKRRRIERQGLFQLFLMDPNGVKIELNFDAAEAQGVSADVIAAELAARG